MPTSSLRDFITAQVPPQFKLQSTYSALMANYVNKKLVNSNENSQTVVDELSSVQASINQNIDDAKNDITIMIANTCPVNSSAHARHLSETAHVSSPLDAGQDLKEKKIEEFLRSTTSSHAKIHASKNGLKEENVDKVFKKILNAFSEDDKKDSFNSVLGAQVTEALSEPGAMDLLDGMFAAEVEANGDKYTIELASQIIEESVDKESRRLNSKFF